MFIPTAYLIVLVFEGRAPSPILIETSPKTIATFSHNFWIYSRFALASFVFCVRFKQFFFGVRSEFNRIPRGFSAASLLFIDHAQAIDASNTTRQRQLQSHKRYRHAKKVFSIIPRASSALYSRFAIGQAETLTASSRLHILIEPTDNRQESLPQKRNTSNTSSPVTLISLYIRPFSVPSPRVWFQVFSGGRICRGRP